MAEKYPSMMGFNGLSQDQLYGYLEGLPLSKQNDYYLASIMFFDPGKCENYTGSWKKRWANQHDHLVDFQKKTKKINVSQGEFKSYDMPLNLWSIPKVWFYFESNQPEYVQKLVLTNLAGIGKKVSQGFGFYDRVEVELENNLSFEKDLLRPIPAHTDVCEKIINRIMQNGGQIQSRFCAYRPPYWGNAERLNCIVPKEMIR
jgi:hypothetical protein